jgi:hypothetical protein
MAYGSVKVDTVIFDDGGSDQNVTVSGLYRATTSGVTLTGTIEANSGVFTSVSGTSVSGVTATFTSVSGVTATFTSVSGTSVSGVTATFTSGIISGLAVTGTITANSGAFTSVSGVTATFTTGITSGVQQLASQTPLRFGDSDNSHYVALRSSATVAANITWDLPAVDGTSGQFLNTNGSGVLGWATALNTSTPVTSSGVTSIDFVGFPSGVKRITIMFSGVSTNTVSNIILQVGSTTYVTTGYSSTLGTITGSNVCKIDQNTSGLLITDGQGSLAAMSGLHTLVTLGSNIWVNNGMAAIGSFIASSAGRITLGDTLDRIRITTTAGTDTFDAGTINVLFES